MMKMMKREFRRLRLITRAPVAAVLLIAGASPHTFAAVPAASVASTAPVRAAYKGWVQIVDEKDAASGRVTHLNTGTGARVDVQKSGAETAIIYEDPKSGEVYDYHASTNLIRRGFLDLDRAERLAGEYAALPVGVDAAIAALRRVVDQDPGDITHKMDQGLDCYDFTAAIDAARNAILAKKLEERPFSFDQELSGIPTTLWIDPASHLTQRALIRGSLIHYSYGGPDIASIYDAGAPRAAAVYDNRPTPETVAVLDRARKRWMTPMPDGVSVILNESANYASINVHEQARDHWIEREYTVRAVRPDGFTIDLPADWTGAGADEFFRRLAGAASRYEQGGTESDVRFQDFTPYTAADTQPKNYPDGSSMTIVTHDHITGRAAKSTTLVTSPHTPCFSFAAFRGNMAWTIMWR